MYKIAWLVGGDDDDHDGCAAVDHQPHWVITQSLVHRTIDHRSHDVDQHRFIVLGLVERLLNQPLIDCHVNDETTKVDQAERACRHVRHAIQTC